MESVNDAIRMMKELFQNIRQAKLLVDDGKEVACSRALQGAKTRCELIIQRLEGVDNVEVAETSDKE
jgi:hypothetical protein